MLDHLLLAVRDLKRSAKFCAAALAPLVHTHAISYLGDPPMKGFGDARESYLLLRKGTPRPGAVNLAFAARSQKAVRAFHEAALAAGGRDNGAPGPRPQYFDGYYAAYVLDPDGYNVEALFQKR